MEEYKYKDITEKVIRAAYSVHNELGYGFLEKLYKNALTIELKEIGIKAETEFPIKVYYRKQLIGNYFADIIVDKKVIIEIKAVKEILPIHEVQLLNYLKATGIEVGLLINFGYSVEVRRKVLKKNI